MLLKRCRNAILCWCLNKLCVYFVFFWQGLEGKKTFCEWSRFCKNCLYVGILSVILCFFSCFCTLLQNFLRKNRQRLTWKGFEHVWIASPTLYFFWIQSRRVWQGVRSWQAPDWPKNNSPSGLPDQWGFRQKIGASEPFATQSETRLPLPIPPTGLMLSNKRWINGNHS